MTEIIRNQVDLQKRMRNINVERPVAALTLRINATFGLGVAGGVLTWAVEIRNLLFTWSGTDITIPTDGMYHICAYFRSSVALATLESGIDIVRGGITYVGVARYELTPAINNTYVFSFTQYFLKDDILRYRLTPSAVTNIIYSAEIVGGAGQSGILHVTQMTGSV